MKAIWTKLLEAMIVGSKRSSRELVLGNEIDKLTRKPLADLVTGACYPEGGWLAAKVFTG
jgi:hypothetical protein